MTIVEMKIQLSGDKENGFEAVLLKPMLLFDAEGEGEDELSAIRDLLDTIWIRNNPDHLKTKPWGAV